MPLRGIRGPGRAFADAIRPALARLSLTRYAWPHAALFCAHTDFGMDAQTPKKSWLDTVTVYFQWPILSVFLLGIASGFPLLLTASTLSARLKESGIDIKTIGIFALVGLPYTLKFLFAPFIDAIRFPGVRSHLAHRKSWCILIQVALAISLLCMAFVDPQTDILWLAAFALLTSFLSASQDVVIDALRVEMLPTESQGAAAAASTTGYRIGMLLAGAGAFVLASYVEWKYVYAVAAAVMAACIIPTAAIRHLYGIEKRAAAPDDATFGTPEHDNTASLQDSAESRDAGRENDAHDAKDVVAKAVQKSEEIRYGGGILYRAVVAPLSDFFRRPAAGFILAFIAFYKLGDAMGGALSTPFYLELGFTKIEIAAITKGIGVAAVFVGTFLGGFIVKRFRIYTALLQCGIMMAASNLVFVWLAYIGHDVVALTACIAVENVTGGMGTATFVAYMSQLCNVRFTATQYALLSSLSSVGRTVVSSTAGFLVEAVGWPVYYVETAVLSIPGMLLLYILYSREKSEGIAANREEEASRGVAEI